MINFKSPLIVFKQKNFVQIQKVIGATATLNLDVPVERSRRSMPMRHDPHDDPHRP